jgi:hypothetical protein
MKLKRALFIALLILGLAVELTSCGKDDSPPKPAPEARKSQPATPSEQPAQPVETEEDEEGETGALPWPPPAEDGGEITLSDNLLARNYYVILDSSGSMGEVRCSGNMTKSAAAKIALAELAKSVPADANLGLAVFDEKGLSERVSLGMENRETFIKAVNATVPGAATPLHDATLLGYRKLEESARRQAGYGEYHLVIVTDGLPYPPAQNPTPVVMEILEQSPVVIHTIGFCIGTDHPLNQPGRTIYKAANNPRELRQGLEEVLAESPDFNVTAFKNK